MYKMYLQQYAFFTCNLGHLYYAINSPLRPDWFFSDPNGHSVWLAGRRGLDNNQILSIRSPGIRALFSTGCVAGRGRQEGRQERSQRRAGRMSFPQDRFFNHAWGHPFEGLFTAD